MAERSLDWERMRLVRMGKHLGYSPDRGLPLPMAVSRIVAHVWNFIACHTFGHEWMPEILGVTKGDGPPKVHTSDYALCIHCPERRHQGLIQAGRSTDG